MSFCNLRPPISRIPLGNLHTSFPSILRLWLLMESLIPLLSGDRMREAHFSLCGSPDDRLSDSSYVPNNSESCIVGEDDDASKNNGSISYP